MLIAINTTGIKTLIIYLHDKTMTTADYSGREKSQGSKIKSNFSFSKDFMEAPFCICLQIGIPTKMAPGLQVFFQS